MSSTSCVFEFLKCGFTGCVCLLHAFGCFSGYALGLQDFVEGICRALIR